MIADHDARATAWALALLSAGVTAAEIALMQLLSCMLWHHFAYLVVAVALLGFGASGTVLTIWRERILASAHGLVSWLMVGAGTGTVLVAPLLQSDLLRFDLYLLFVAHDQWLRLVVACLLIATPFFCAGLATAIILTAGATAAGRLYFANLSGAGAGAMLGLVLLESIEPARAPVLASLASLAGAVVLSGSRRSWPGTAAAGLVVIAALAVAARAGMPAMSPFKDLARALDLPDSRIVYGRPSAQGWLQIVDAPALRAAPPANLAFAGRVPHQLAVFIDGNRHGSILHDPANDALEVFDASVESLPWRIGTPDRILLLHEGAGGEAAFAARLGAGEILLVESHRELGFELRRRLDAVTGLTVQIEDPRHTLARDENRYDLIRFPTVGSLGGSAGLRAVGEEFLLTREAIATAWRTLGEDGTLLVTAWMDHPERSSLRLLATLAAGLNDAGIAETGRHLAAVRGWASVTCIVRRPPLDTAQVAAIRAFCDEHGFDPLLLPEVTTEERTHHHDWDNPGFFAQVDAIVSSGGETPAHSGSFFRLDAPTDARPYFSQFLRPTALGALARVNGLRGVPFFELGSIIVAVTFVVLVALAAVLIALPLARVDARGSCKSWTLLTFALLGAGFMLLEIVLMQRLTLFAGGAVPAAAIVIATMLAGAGLGSRWSQRCRARPENLAWITAAAAGATAFLGAATGALPIGWSAPWAVRALACAVLIAPAAFVLGMAFPTGLRYLAVRAPSQLPWAWAVNSCVSVATPSLATLLALAWGHPAVFWLAAAAYATAALATLTLVPSSLNAGSDGATSGSR